MFRIVMTSIIVVHSILGTALLVTGFLAIRAPKRRDSRHPRLGDAYFALLLMVLSLGLVIGSRDPAISPFEYATVFTFALGLQGWVAVRRKPRWRGRPWLFWHITGMAGSYIGVVTASSFQVVPRIAGDGLGVQLLIWSTPTIVGSVLIGIAIARRGGLRPVRPQVADQLASRP
jgi:hypothetical protein